jgi:predicted O-methyltransferase YrrM
MEETPKVAFPMGHFYNPVPSDADIEDFIAKRQYNCELKGIDLNLPQQIENYHKLMQFRDDFIWRMEKQENLSYYGNNDQFAIPCAYPVYAFMRLLRPRRIIEIGSGYSTAIMVDTNRVFLDNHTKITCIEPYPERLLRNWGNHISDYITLYDDFFQNINPMLFDSLSAGDICFIDSSHVGKLNSDVLKIIFELLPRLASGVIIHFHDIPYPFEYYDHWLRENRAWNEAYILRAFLQYNNEFEIIYWGSCLVHCADSIPDGDLGGSIWLRKK